MSDIDALVDRYCEGWSDSSAQQRELLVRSTLTDAATYCDPRTIELNVAALLDYITTLQNDHPRVQVCRTSTVDSYRSLARFDWHVMLPDGTTLLEGTDIIELNADRTKIDRIIGFFGRLERLHR